jgi:hypothetical protein
MNALEDATANIDGVGTTPILEGIPDRGRERLCGKAGEVGPINVLGPKIAIGTVGARPRPARLLRRMITAGKVAAADDERILPVAIEPVERQRHRGFPATPEPRERSEGREVLRAPPPLQMLFAA